MIVVHAHQIVGDEGAVIAVVALGRRVILTRDAFYLVDTGGAGRLSV